MTQTSSEQAIRAVALSIVILLSVSTVSVALSGGALAAVNTGTVTVSDSVVSSDDVITVSGTLSSDTPDTVAFRIVDSDGNQDFVSKSASDAGTTFTSTSFEADIDLANDLETSLSEGEVTVYVDHRDGYIDSDDSETFRVDDTPPTLGVDSVTEPTSPPVITGSVTGTDVDTVQVAIRNSDGDYYQSDGGKTGSRTWLDATVDGDGWSYETSGLGLSEGDYDVYVRASDETGNQVSYFDGPGHTDLSTAFTLDTTAPSLTGVAVTDGTDGDGTVTEGDTVFVSADVTDDTSGVGTVTVDASDLGGDASEPLSLDSGSTYLTSFTVTDPEVAEGSHSLTVTATDNHGTTATMSDTIDLETSIYSVEDLTIHQDFIGIVSDENRSVRVTASDITDQQGNEIADEPTTLTVGGHDYDVTVTDGTLDARINPEDIPDSQPTGTVTVELPAADSGDNTDSVTLVDEANNLEEGYQIEGTPMDAESVVLQHTNEQMGYDPVTETRNFQPDLTTAGSAYFIHGINDTARIGYVFSDQSESRTRHLYRGYNLVAATPDLNQGTDIGVSTEFDKITLGTNDEVYLPKDAASPISNADNIEYTELSGDMTAYQGYYIYIDSSGEKYGVITDEQYDP